MAGGFAVKYRPANNMLVLGGRIMPTDFVAVSSGKRKAQAQTQIEITVVLVWILIGLGMLVLTKAFQKQQSN